MFGAKSFDVWVIFRQIIVTKLLDDFSSCSYKNVAASLTPLNNTN